MKRILLLSLLACMGLQATTISLTATATNTFTGGGISVTVRSYSSTNGTSFSNASLQNFGSGLGIGVCSTAETSAQQCNQDDWQFSNYNGNREFLLFTFDQNVTVQSILQLQSACGPRVSYVCQGYDNDFQWWYATTAINSLTSLASFTTGGTYNGNGMVDPTFGSPYATNTATINTSGLRTLLLAIGQSSTDTSDKFKLNSLEVTGGVRISEVPEPGSMALLGSGLIGVGLLARRRRK